MPQREVTMISLGEDFKPSLKYKPYLAISTVIAAAFIWACIFGWILFIQTVESDMPVWVSGIAVGILAAVLIFVLVWVVLYYKSVTYHLNQTEMTWKRGVWFRKTGIVPYNRITNVDIVQGPIMRLFGISNLKIQTAGYSGSNNSSEIALEGIEDPEPLRALIMDYVRGSAPSGAATGVSETVTPAAKDANIAALIADVAAIRKLLEEERK